MENSAFSEIILKIQERIAAQVPGIRMVDEDKGQLEDYDRISGKPPVSWPCLLIGFEDFTFDDIGNNAQMVSGNVILRLGFPPFSSASSWMPAATKQKALKYFDYEWQIYKALHGWAIPGLGYMNCRQANTERREDTIRVRVLAYEVSFEEYSASPLQTIISKPPEEFNGEIVTEI